MNIFEKYNELPIELRKAIREEKNKVLKALLSSGQIYTTELSEYALNQACLKFGIIL